MTEIAVGRRERKKEETKQRIFVTAVQLFNEKGFDATTIDEIAERADVAKGTFFNYFPRKESLLQYLAEQWLDAAEETASQTRRPAAERIVEMFTSAAVAYGENRDLARALAHFSMEQLGAPMPELEGGDQRLDRLFDRVFREGQERGEFRSDVDAFAARGALGSVFIGTLMWWIGTRDGRVDPRAREIGLAGAVRYQCQLVFDGLRPRTGS
jgi:AcrR family transcriptional regulator